MDRVGECNVLGYTLGLYGENKLFKGQEVGDMVDYMLDTNNYKSRDIRHLLDLAEPQNVTKYKGRLYINKIGLYQILLRSYKADKYREKLNVLLVRLGVEPVPVKLYAHQQMPEWKRKEVIDECLELLD